MTTETFTELGQALSLHGRLPVKWSYCASLDDIFLAQLNESNKETFQLLNTLERVQLDERESVADPVQSELKQLDNKVELILDLLVRLFGRQLDIPEPSSIVLTNSALSWECPQAPAPDRMMMVELYLNPRYPQAVKFLGQVSTNSPPSEASWIHMDFVGLDESVRHALEKFIFRRHRRNIAVSRRR